MRLTSACLLALAALLFLGSGERAHADDPVHVTTNVNYEVRAEEGDVLVTWDVSVANNAPGNFYFAIPIPVLAGATDVTATSAAGAPLFTSAEPTENGLIDLRFVSFDRDVFFGDVYSFTLSYVVPEARQSGLVVTPFYFFLPLLALGDKATVTTTTPDAVAWSVSLEPVDCELTDGALACSDSEAIYFAGNLEVSQPNATQTDSFDLVIDGNDVTATIVYFRGEDALAAHQREVIEVTMPLIADAYGFPYPGTSVLNIAHSGRESVRGYEGLASCTPAPCMILIAPGAGDYTLVHELAHFWSDMFTAAWLAEGFADWVATQVVDRAPEGLLSGNLTPRPPATVPLQLHQWRTLGSAIGASAEDLATLHAGYDYSLRFLRTLADELGAETLRDVNRTLAEREAPVGSRRYMDTLEEVSGRNVDSLFLTWVFPETSRTSVERRRETRDRYAEVADRLADEGLSEEPLEQAWESILVWGFSKAQSELDAVEANIARASEFEAELRILEGEADPLGLALPDSITAAISGWEFGAAEDLMESARAGLAAYASARERVAEPRNVWEQFGLLGDDPNGELAKAREAFEKGRFDRTRERSAAAVAMVNDASRSAMMRLLVVAGILSAVAGAIGVAYWVALLRRRRLAGR
ncbi:MAG: hypothetical protein DRI30_05695 [Chloroflexi bacterium]|nr:MAG: hypothetical protein DRI30_05695 [Chloroflexota bacterium]